MAIKQKRHTRLNITFSTILALVILGSIAFLIYLITAPSMQEKFTEFYILGPGGMAENYPKELAVNEEAKVIVGIISQEHRAVSYRVIVRINGEDSSEWDPVDLVHGEKAEEIISFQPITPGDNQKVEFLLFKQGQSEIYQSLHLWINVGN